MKFRVTVPGESAMYEVDIHTTLGVGDKITLGSGRQLEVHAIIFAPINDPHTPQFIIQAS